MAKKKEFFSSFDKNLSIAEEVATVNTEAPPVVKTTTIKKAVTKAAPTPAPTATAVAEQLAPKLAVPEVATTPAPKAKTQLVKKTKAAPVAAPSDKLVKSTNTARPTTFRIDVDLMETIKAVAYWERKKIQDVLDDALRDYLTQIPKQELTKAKKAYSSAN